MNDPEPAFPTPPQSMSEVDFVELFGGVYEHSPWIARETWRRGLGIDEDTPAGLSAAMMETVRDAPRERLSALVDAHPDLAGRAAVGGELTAESTAEQAGAGIDQCTPEEFQRFQSLNSAYRRKFGFPFIMAVKESNRHQILAAFEARLQNDPGSEFERALAEVHRIARFRLVAIAQSQAANSIR